MTDIFEHLLVLRTPGIGPVKYNDLLNQYGTVSAVVDAIGVSGDVRDAVMREIDVAQKMGIQFIHESDDLYPRALKNAKNHPPVITVRGNVSVLGRTCVGIVGTRHATATGMEFIANMAHAFAAHGVAVVSGMAMGTDTAAHVGALRADGKNNTIAVLAGGVDYIWPLENEKLYYQILERGAVVSEMPIGFIPKGTNFVQRNRIIAGIGDKLILSEADSNSGSMKTAAFAKQFARQIYAIPSHPADSRAAGPNSLIRSGDAILCQGLQDFFVCDTKQKQNEKKSESENSILDKLGTIPLSESVLAQIAEKSISEIKRELIVLELQGLIRKQDGGYVRC